MTITRSQQRGWSARQTMEFAHDHQFDGVQFLEPAQIDQGLDAGKLTEFRRWVEAMGLYLEVGLPSPNPVRRARELGRAVDPAERARELVPHVEALARLGCRHARVYVGDRHDRFRTDTRWSDQIAATIDVIRRLDRPAQGAGNQARDRDARRLDRRRALLDPGRARPRDRRGDARHRQPGDEAGRSGRDRPAAGPARGCDARQGRGAGIHARAGSAGRRGRSARGSCRCPTSWPT